MKRIISLLVLFVVANISYLGYCAENNAGLRDNPAKIDILLRIGKTSSISSKGSYFSSFAMATPLTLYHL